MPQLSQKPLDVLMIEDNPSDVILTQEAFNCTPEYSVSLHVASTGNEGMDFLNKRGDFVASPTPSLILLDLNLPLKSGFDVLAEVRQTPHICYIPIIILSTSTNLNEVKRCYELGANSYIAKPVDFEEFEHLTRWMQHFWFKSCILPSVDEAKYAEPSMY